MRNSNSLYKDFDKKSQSSEEISKQWDFLSKRLSQVQKGLTVLQKKYTKMQKKLNTQAKETNEYHMQLTEQILQIKTTAPTKLEIKQETMRQIQNMENQIRKACSEEITKCFDGLSLTMHEKNDGLQLKIRTVYDQTKSYVDRAIFELKEILKKYVKEQNELERKLQRSSRQNSPSFMPKSSLSKSKSAKRLFDTSQRAETVSQKHMQSSYDWPDRSRQNVSKQSINSQNRVSYLREKLKQFQKINKKYEAEADKNKDKEQAMKKMRNYRDYLEQSESELEPSNLLTSEQLSGYSGMKKNFHPY